MDKVPPITILVTTTLKLMTKASTMKTSKLDRFDQTKAEKHQRKTKIYKANQKKKEKIKRAKTRKVRINLRRRRKVKIEKGKNRIKNIHNI